MDDLLTTQEVADQLRVSVATVNRYARDGRLRSINLPGERRFRREDIASFLAELLTAVSTPVSESEAS